MTFMDYEKALDSVENSSSLDAAQEQGIDERYIKVLGNIYTRGYNHVINDKSP